MILAVARLLPIHHPLLVISLMAKLTEQLYPVRGLDGSLMKCRRNRHTPRPAALTPVCYHSTDHHVRILLICDWQIVGRAFIYSRLDYCRVLSKVISQGSLTGRRAYCQLRMLHTEPNAMCCSFILGVLTVTAVTHDWMNPNTNMIWPCRFLRREWRGHGWSQASVAGSCHSARWSTAAPEPGRSSETTKRPARRPGKRQEPGLHGWIVISFRVGLTKSSFHNVYYDSAVYLLTTQQF